MPKNCASCSTRLIPEQGRLVSRHKQEFDHLMLAFTAGLLPSLCSKVADVKGSFEQLLVKAHFEKAKLQDAPVNPSSIRHRSSQTLEFWQVVTRNLTTGLLRDVTSVMVWATTPRTTP